MGSTGWRQFLMMGLWWGHGGLSTLAGTMLVGGCASDFARQVLSFFKQHRAGLAVLGQEAAAYEFRA